MRIWTISTYRIGMWTLLFFYASFISAALQTQERFRPESWQFDRRASLRDLERGSALERYRAAVGVFIQAIGRNERDIEDAIEAMKGVYEDARARVRTEQSKKELAIFESMLGWFYMGLAETSYNTSAKENAARKGLRYLEPLLRENRNNLDILFIYVRSTWFIPTTYQDLTRDIEDAGERFLNRSRSAPDNDLHRVQRNVVLIALANIALETNDKDRARDYLRQVDSRSLRYLEDYGCRRLEDVYFDIEKALEDRTERRVRTTW